MPINTLPTPPTRQDPANFADRADTFLAALPNFATEANQLASEVNVNAGSALVSANNAQAAATAAQASAGVTLWNAGTSYTLGQTVYSPTTFYTYRRKIAGQTATDPASDATNWAQVTGTGNVSTNVSGDLGIGGTPSAKIHALSSGNTWMSVSSPAGFTSSLNIAGNGTGLFSTSFDLYQNQNSAAVINNRSNAPMIFHTNAIERFRIDAEGDVGIGTTNPTTALQVSRNSGFSRIDIQQNGTTGTDYAQLTLSRNSGCNAEYIVDSNAAYIGTTTAHQLQLRVNTVPRVYIDTNGDVGIGVSNPTSKLHVNGGIALSVCSFVSTSTYTVAEADSSIRFSVGCTVTLPAASSFPGRIINFVTVTAAAINAVDTTNGAVLPLNSSTGGTAILPATAGKCVTLQSTGTNWVAIAGN